MARFFFFGLASTVPLLCFREQLKQLTWQDWLAAFKLAFIGNAVYYGFLSTGIKLSGAPLAGMLMSLIPVLVALATNRKTAENTIVVPWSKLAIPLTLIVLGLIIANITEFRLLSAGSNAWTFIIGALCSATATLLWTWFPIRNGQWIARHKNISPFAWTTAQGLTLIPSTFICYLVLNWDSVSSGMPFGQLPWYFCLLMLMSGIVCGWGGMALWNFMSSRLPLALSGQMIVFETIFSVIYAHIYRGQLPSWTLIVGMFFLLFGVLYSLKIFRAATSVKQLN